MIQRTDKVRADGQASLALQAFINGQRKVISLDVSVPLDCWDANSQQVLYKRRSIPAREYNVIIGKARIKAEEIFNDYRIRDAVLTVEQFTRQFTQQERKLVFLDFCRRYLDGQKGLYAYDTVRNYQSTIRLIEAYRKDTTYADLTIEWVLGLERFMKQRRLDVNTVAKRHAHIKHMITVLRREYPIPHPYENYRIKRSSGKRTYLLSHEVAELERMYESRDLGPTLQRSLRTFLFMCHTGLRHSDANTVSWDQIQDGFLRFRPRKTDSLARQIQIPVTESALRYASPTSLMMEPEANQVFNRNMKQVARLAGIRKTVTAHVARHTFATNFLAGGGSIEVLQRILGHSNLSTTQVYVHVADERMMLERARVMDHMYKP